MQIIANNIEQLSTLINSLIKFDKHSDYKSYGHINETNMVYVYRGVYNEYKVTQNENTFTFEYVCGDRILGHKILTKLKYMVENNGQLPLERQNATEQYTNIEEYFLKYLMDLDDYIFKANAIEYITQLSTKLNDYLFLDDFRELYLDKYEYIMYEKIEQYLRFNSENELKIISLFHLIDVIYFHCPLSEYKELLLKYTQSTHPYVQKIAIEMLM